MKNKDKLPIITIVLWTIPNTADPTVHPVYIRFNHNGSRNYVATGKYFSPKDWESSTSREVIKAKKELEDKVNAAVNKCSQLNFKSFKNAFLGGDPEASDKSLSEMVLVYIKEHDLAYRTRIGYEYLRTEILRYEADKSKRLMVSSFSKEDLDAFVKWMPKSTSRGKGKTTIARLVREVKSVGIYAVEKHGIVNAFYSTIVPPSPNVGTKILTFEEFKKFRDYKCKDKFTQFGQDWWVFMVYCGGIETRSIVELKWKDVNSDAISYLRSKTEDSTDEPIKVLIGRTKRINNMLEVYSVKGNQNDYVFPFIKHGWDEEKIVKRVDSINKRIQKNCKKIMLDIGLDVFPTAKMARPTFAVMADELGFTVQEIQRLLGHSNIMTTEIYMKRIPRRNIVNLAHKFDDMVGG